MKNHSTTNRCLRPFARAILLGCILAATGKIFAADTPPVSKTPPILTEDFESTPVGAIPDGFTGDINKVAVRDDFANSGKKALRIEPATRGARQITLKGDVLAKLGGQFWGRLYYRVQQPYPVSTNGVIHSTLVSGTATSPQFNDPIDVRLLGTVENKTGAHQFLYNVQPRKRGEFGKGSAYLYHYTNEWTLAEWSVNYDTQSYHLYINGEEITSVARDNGATNFTKVELPKEFTNLSFGWNNYQAAGTGFVVWIDDIALGKERIGPLAPSAP